MGFRVNKVSGRKDIMVSTVFVPKKSLHKKFFKTEKHYDKRKAT